jgi:ribosomal protein L21E
MIREYRIGRLVQIHYAAKWRPVARYHGAIGTIAVVSPRGSRPFNVAVEIDGVLVTFPAGQLREPKNECR